MSDDRLTLSDWLDIRLGALRDWFHRCPECGRRGYSNVSPRWQDDKTAQMLGIAAFGCPECGHSAIEERDAACDHTRCCRYHGTHSMPHKGCILR